MADDKTNQAPEAQAKNAAWQEHKDRQGRDWLKLTYAQRLQWLEQAKQFASLALQAAQQRKSTSD